MDCETNLISLLLHQQNWKKLKYFGHIRMSRSNLFQYVTAACTVQLSNYDFKANTWHARASSIGQERQFDSLSAVKQAVPSAKRLPLPMLRILNSN